MNKHKVIVFIVIIIFTLLIITNISDTSISDNVRIRVVANSNSTTDQNIKHECVNIIKSVINANDDINQITSKLKLLENKLSYISKRYNINIEVGLGKMEFPPKSLNAQLIPGGKYQTLYVLIGEAKGKNYWTLLYPEYFDISFEDINSGDVEFKFYFKEIFAK